MGDEANGNAAPAGSRKKIALGVFAAAALATVASGVVYWWYSRTHVSTDDAFVEGRIHVVAPRIPGTVVEVLVADNQPVRKGQPILRIDAEPYAVRESAAASALSAATADVAAARSDVAAARSDAQAAREDLAAALSQRAQAGARIEAVRAGVRLAEARFAQSERDAERAANLFARNAVSRERHEKAQTDRDVARAQAEAARDELRLAEAAAAAQEAVVSQRRAQVAQKEAVLLQREARVGQQAATVRQRQSSLEEAKLMNRYTDVVSPADGYVTRKSVEVGQVVSPAQPLLAIAALDNVWIVANYKETQLEKIKPGQPVTIRVDTYPGRTFRGTVDSIMAGTGSAFSLFPPENATGNYVKVVQRVPVKIVLAPGEDAVRALRIGMSVQPTVRVRD